MYWNEEPDGFEPKFQSGGCFIQYGDDILLLLRQDHLPQGNTWGIPGGKFNKGWSDPVDEVTREIGEETGLNIPADRLSFVDIVYVRYPDYDFIYHFYKTELDRDVDIVIDPREHKDKIWTPPLDALGLNLMLDLDDLIREHYNLIP